MRTLAESVLADAMLLSGVDFAHTLGRNELRERMTADLQRLVREQRLGLTVDDVTIANVSPPLRVKAEFIDVMNAAPTKRRRSISASVLRTTRSRRSWSGEANDRLGRGLPSAIGRSGEGRGGEFFEAHRAVAIRRAIGPPLVCGVATACHARKYLDTLEEVLRKVAAKVVLDSGQAIDLTILREQKSSAK